MKRIKAACMLQTIHFQLSEKLEHDAAVEAAQQDWERYKNQMDRQHTKYRVVQEERQPDGSILVRIKKQYNQYNCDEYMN